MHTAKRKSRKKIIQRDQSLAVGILKPPPNATPELHNGFSNDDAFKCAQVPSLPKHRL
jgi:hypothetical protein